MGIIFCFDKYVFTSDKKNKKPSMSYMSYMSDVKNLSMSYISYIVDLENVYVLFSQFYNVRYVRHRKVFHV